MKLIEYIASHPSYIIVVLLTIITISILLVKINRDLGRDDRDDDDDEGGFGGNDDFDPDLDLPPGVSLPIDHPKEREPALI